MEVDVENPDRVKDAEIIVGIPSYNEADSIAYPTQMASQGLLRYFPGKKSVIINVDNRSPDGTKDVLLNSPTEVPKIYISTPQGVRGKGSNLRNLFEATVELSAKAVVVVDADLKSITPRWIQYLGEPLFAGFHYVTPIYIRHKYDGSITNHIAYPLLRTLFGLRVRQPIGGDFGFSRRMAQAFLSEKIWNKRIANFGIDIWMTTVAIARRFNVCQTFLGSPKSHRTKDPAKHLGPMFMQVITTIFDLMIDGVKENPPPVKVNKDALYTSFITGFDTFGDVWKKIIPKPELIEIQKTKKIPKKQFYYQSDLWARILFNYAIAYKNYLVPKEQLIESMIPFYHSRILSFVNKTAHKDTKECEEYFESIVRVFEAEKSYLVKRWDKNNRKLGYKLLKF
jgi:hypothetical protein